MNLIKSTAKLLGAVCAILFISATLWVGFSTFGVRESVAQSQPTIAPRAFGRYITDITGSNTTIAAAKTFSNINPAMVIDAWKYDDCWVYFQGKADGSGSASNVTLVFAAVDENDSTPSSGTDIIARGQYVNLFCAPGSNASAIVWGWANLPGSNGMSYKLWMVTNAGANWTNVSIKAVARARQVF